MEPERPIEKALRAAAKQRQGGAGSDYQLHPATRRLLQNEVARQYPAPAPPATEARSGFGWFSQAWPRVAWSVAGLAVLAIAGVVWLNLDKPSERLLARNESSQSSQMGPEQLSASPPPEIARKAPSQQTAAAEPEAAATPRRQRDETPSKLAGEPLALQQRSVVAESPALADAAQTRSFNSVGRAVPGPAPAAPLEPPPASAALPLIADNESVNSTADLASKQESLARSSTAGPAKKALLAGAQTTSPVDSLASEKASGLATSSLFMDKGTKESAFAQHFVQAPVAVVSKDVRRDADKKLPAPILTSFDVEQSGRELRVIDKDGSVYTGYLQEVVTGSTAGAFARKPSLALAPAGIIKSAPSASKSQSVSQPSGSYIFQVVGTNRSLGQRVFFSGNVFGLTNTLLRYGFQNGQSRAAGDSAHDSSNQPSELKVIIQRVAGKAVIGRDRTNEINAVLQK